MNNSVSLYTSFNGRISRKTWWLAMIALTAVVLIVIGVPVWLQLFNLSRTYQYDTAASLTALADFASKQKWVGLVVYIVYCFPLMALCIKRQHDRNKSGKDIMVVIGLKFIFGILSALEIGYVAMDVGHGVMVPRPSLPFIMASVPVSIYAFYLFLVLGFLKGTDGPNQYGPNPLTVRNATAVSPA